MADTTETLIYEIIIYDDKASDKYDAWAERFKDMQKAAKKVDIGGKITASMKGVKGNVTRLLVNPLLGAFRTIASAGLSAFGTIANVTKDLFVDAAVNAIDLQDALAGVRKTAGLTADQTAELQTRVRDFSAETLRGMISAQDLAKALEIAGQQGVFTGKSFQQGSEDALAFARVMTMAGDALSGLTVESAAEQLGLFHGTFSDVIPDIERAASVLNFFGDTTKRSEGFILRLAGGLSQATSAAGISEQATLALAASLGDIQQQASTSGTAFSRIFGMMQRDTTQFAQAFGINAQKFRDLVENDMEGAVVLLAKSMQEMLEGPGGTIKFNKALGDLRLTGRGVSNVMFGLAQNAEGVSEAIHNANIQFAQNDSLLNSFIAGSDRVSKLWGALKEIWANTIGLLGDMLLPVLKDLLLDVNQLAIEFRTWLKETDFIKNQLAPALDNIGVKIQELVESAIEFVKDVNWGSVAKQATMIAKDVLAMAKALPGVAKFFVSIAKSVNAIAKTFGDMKFVKMLQISGKGLEGIAKILNGDILGGVKLLGGALKDAVIENLNTVKNIVAGIGKAILGLVTGPIKKLGTALEGVWKKLAGAIKGSEEAAKKTAKAIDGVNVSQQKVLAEGVTNSVWPDLKAAIDATNRSVSHFLISMQEAVYTSQRASAEAAKYRQSSTSRLSSPSSSSGRTSRSSSPPSQRSSTSSMTVNFTGLNIVDESSKNRFAREITKLQRGLGSNVIQAT